MSAVSTTEPSGYIAYSTALRWGVPSPHCRVRVAARSGQKVELKLIDFDQGAQGGHQQGPRGGPVRAGGGSEEGGCPVYVAVEDGQQQKNLALCDSRERTSLLYMSASDVILIHFTLTRQTTRNFVIHYQG